jgi:hypothetical protein
VVLSSDAGAAVHVVRNAPATKADEVPMTHNALNRIRHSIRPLSVFSFCGQPIAAPRDEYHVSTKDLPPCTECQRARERAQQMLGGKHRRLV